MCSRGNTKTVLKQIFIVSIIYFEVYEFIHCCFQINFSSRSNFKNLVKFLKRYTSLKIES